jgi:hypothetical protein
MIFLGAFGELYLGMSQIWGLPLGEEIKNTCFQLQFFLGALLGISTINYKIKQNNLLPHSSSISEPVMNIIHSENEDSEYLEDDENV